MNEHLNQKDEEHSVIGSFMEETLKDEITRILKDNIPKDSTHAVVSFLRNLVDKYTGAGMYLIMFRGDDGKLKLLEGDETFLDISIDESDENKMKLYHQKLKDLSRLELFLSGLIESVES